MTKGAAPAACSTTWRRKNTSRSRPRPSSSPRAATAGSISAASTRRITTARPATAWSWPTGPGPSSFTWIRSSTIRPAPRFPSRSRGFLITEKIRGAGGQPINKLGELFVWPREPRDVESAAFIRECLERKNGIQTPSGRWGVWLDSPLIDTIQGAGYINKNFPAMYRQFIRYSIDITKEPMLVYPSLHYQNGGVEINDRCETQHQRPVCRRRSLGRRPRPEPADGQFRPGLQCLRPAGRKIRRGRT